LRTRRVLRLNDFLDMTKDDVIFGVIENVTLNQVPDPDGNTTLGLVFTVTYEGLDLKYASGIVQYSQAIVVVVPEELKGITEVVLPTHESALYVRRGGGNYERVTEGTMASIENVIKNQVQADSENKREVILCKPPQSIKHTP
jgi:hypothetical protein